MTAFQNNLIELVKRQDAKTITVNLLKFLSRHLFLILILLWTPLLLFQTWNVQHSCFPLVNWGGDRCPIERVFLSPRDLTVKVGKSQLLKADVRVKASVKNTHSVDRGVHWVSSNEKIATVDAQGRVVAVAPGSAKITATSNKDKTKSETAVILVEGIAGVEIMPVNLAIEVGESRSLVANINGFGNFSNAVNWSSANNQIATVDNNGLVKGITQGETSIQAATKQDSYKSATTKVTVSEIVNIERLIIALDGQFDDFRAGEVRAITATVEGLRANSDDVTWSSSNPDIAIVNGQGHEVQIETIAAGNVTITATSNQDRSKKGILQLKIMPPIVTHISLQPEKLELDINSQAKFCSKVEGKGSIERNIYWSSSNDQIADVDSDGVVTPRLQGEVQIFAVSKQSPEQYATATVKIPRGINWLAIGAASIIAAGATVVGVPLPAAIALGSATAVGIHTWQGVNLFLCS